MADELSIRTKLFTPRRPGEKCRIGLVVFHGEGREHEDRAWHMSIDKAKALIDHLQGQVETAEKWRDYEQVH